MSAKSGPPDISTRAMKRYGVSRGFLKNFGLHKFLSLREDVRRIYAREHQRLMARRKETGRGEAA